VVESVYSAVRTDSLYKADCVLPLKDMEINPLNAELNPICHLLALLGAHHIFHVSGLRVNALQNNVSIRLNSQHS